MRTNRQDFNKYLLAEYQNIAEAHFRTIEAISSFFRYYLIIMALPITLYSAIIALSPEIGQFIHLLGLLSAVISLVIATVGFCVFIYIANLRMDVVLYARTVNAIRKYFYDQAPLDLHTKLQMRVLPQTASLPSYFERSYFFVVIISFALFNSVYLFLGLVLFSMRIDEILQFLTINGLSNLVKNISPLAWGVSIGFFLFHVIAYWRIARHREHAYLRSYALGVDIDGVLNMHRHHFCKLLDRIVHKQLDPEQITTIPLHEDPTLGVSRSDENLVFNDARYWVKMPHMRNAAYNVAKLRNAFKMKIHMFSYRPWPSKEIRESIGYEKWICAAIQMYKSSQLLVPRLLRKLHFNTNLYKIVEIVIDGILYTRMKTRLWRLKLEPIDLITKCWLHNHKFQYDELTVERGSEDIADPRGQFRNRFYISRRKKLRFFVEDDSEKAGKLGYICDVVFLIKHPYNKNKRLPDNVIPISSWEEIYRSIRKLS